MADQDAYINVAGGIKISEPSLDLAAIMAIISAYKNKPLDPRTVVFGEVGLSGEVRAVSQAELRVKEASKLGFATCIMPLANVNESIKKIQGIEVIGVKNISEAKNIL